MKNHKLLLTCAFAALVAGCSVHAPSPVAVVRPHPIVVGPAPILVGPAPIVVAPTYRPAHPGRGWGPRKHHDHH